MSKMRVRLTITGTYEVNPAHYPGTTIEEFAAFDQETARGYPPDAMEWMDANTVEITVLPDGRTFEESQALCPANHGSQCCGAPEVCASVSDLPDSEFE